MSHACSLAVLTGTFAAMGRLFIIRHGQASFGAPDYDQLSPLGQQQSERLGRFFAEQSISFGATYIGTNKRHHQTASGISSALSAAGREPLGEYHTLEGLKEFPALELFRMHSQSPLTGESGADEEVNSFEAICEAWMHGTIDSGPLETAMQFEQRVESALLHICQRQEESRHNALVVTSGGPTMIAMKSVLGLNAQKSCDVLWAIANASITELRYRKGKLLLSAFNRIPHLESDHVTYR